MGKTQAETFFCEWMFTAGEKGVRACGLVLAARLEFDIARGREEGGGARCVVLIAHDEGLLKGCTNERLPSARSCTQFFCSDFRSFVTLLAGYIVE